jgi:hypothetical protein
MLRCRERRDIVQQKQVTRVFTSRIVYGTHNQPPAFVVNLNFFAIRLKSEQGCFNQAIGLL